MIVKPWQRGDELKFGSVERERILSDGVDLNTDLVRSRSFGHSGEAGSRRWTVSDEYRHARYVGTLALNN